MSFQSKQDSEQSSFKIFTPTSSSATSTYLYEPTAYEPLVFVDDEKQEEASSSIEKDTGAYQKKPNHVEVRQENDLS